MIALGFNVLSETHMPKQIHFLSRAITEIWIERPEESVIGSENDSIKLKINRNRSRLCAKIL